MRQSGQEMLEKLARTVSFFKTSSAAGLLFGNDCPTIDQCPSWFILHKKLGQIHFKDFYFFSELLIFQKTGGNVSFYPMN